MTGVLVGVGEPLTRVADRLGTTLEALLRVNPSVVDPDDVEAGTVLVIPSLP